MVAIINTLNDYRDTLFNKSQNDPALNVQFTNWLGHKVVTLITIPVNLTLFTGSLTLCALSCVTIGTAKFATNFFTLGSVKLPISTGFETLMKSAGTGFWGLGVSLGELTYDTFNLAFQSYRFAHYAIKELHLEGIISVIVKKVAEAVKFCFRKMIDILDFGFTRICKGFSKASESENSVENFDQNLFFPLSAINCCASKHRINIKVEERKVSKVLKHYIWSIPTIICNTPLAAISACAFAILGSVFTLKAAVYALTNINIAIPTYANKAFAVAAYAGFNVASDLIVDVADVFVLSYKAIDSLGIMTAAQTVFKCLAYAKEAFFH